jgi:Transglutaminase-like superfamily
LPRARATHSTVEYLPEFGRTVRIAEFDRPMRSDDEETAQTVLYMDELAAADADTPAVIGASIEALDAAGLDDNASDFEKTCAVYWWLKRTVRYVPTPGTSQLVDQTLITPTAVLAMPEPIGDCPQFSMLANAMLRALCIDSLFVTIAAERMAPEQWSHIYNIVEVGAGKWMPFDSSNGPEPGAEYARPYKKKVWPRIAPNECRKGKTVMLRTTRQRPAVSMRNRALRGAMGDVGCDQDGNCYDNESGIFTPAPIDLPVITPTIDYNPDPSVLQVQAPMTGNANPDCVFGGTWPNCNPPPGATTSSTAGLSANQAAAIVGATVAPIVKAATQQAPYYVTNPATGQAALYNPNTGTFVGATAALSALSPTTLLIGAAILGLLFLGGKK